MSDRIKHLSSSDFKETISAASTPVLVDFWAPWCGPCKAIAPLLEELAGELEGKVQICKVDVDENGDLAAQFSVRAIPTLILFKDGQVANQFVGMVGKADLKSKLAEYTG